MLLGTRCKLVLAWEIMRGIKTLRGISSLVPSTLIEGLEFAARTLTTAPDLKSVLKEKIPEQQVRADSAACGLVISLKTLVGMSLSSSSSGVLACV